MPDTTSLAAAKAVQQIFTARKTRTIYVREEDQPIWDKAKELIGDSLSTYLTNHLKGIVASREAAIHGFDRIVLNFYQKGLPVSKAFHGRWLISPDKPYVNDRGKKHYEFAVAITPKQNVVVFQFWSNDFGAVRGLGESLETYRFDNGDLTVYGSFEEASETTHADLIAQAMERLGIVVQELDI